MKKLLFTLFIALLPAGSTSLFGLKLTPVRKALITAGALVGAGAVAVGGKALYDYKKSTRLSPSQINQPIMDPLAGLSREGMRDLRDETQARVNQSLAESARRNLPAEPEESRFGDPRAGIDPKMLQAAQEREKRLKSESPESRNKRFARVDQQAQRDIAEKEAARDRDPRLGKSSGVPLLVSEPEERAVDRFRLMTREDMAARSKQQRELAEQQEVTRLRHQ